MEPPFQGTKTLQPFSPRWTDPELLEKTLVGRRELVDKLEQLVLEGAGGPNKFQRLMIGPRGSGKTHVLKVLHSRLGRNAALQDRLLIAYLLEDELGVASFLDFLVRLLKAVAAWYPENTALAKGLDELYDLPPSSMQRRAIELLMQAAGNRDVLIIMENLGVTFDEIQGFGRKGQQALRDLVQQHPRFMIFASAQALLDGISQPNAPFYQFFTVTHLKKLSLDEAMELLTTVAAAYGNTEVTKFLGTIEGRSRVRAIYEFTGGNHRLLVTFFDLLSADSLAKVSDAFIDALKPLKPYYQEQMRALSAQQQKIVQYLSLERTPQTVKQIARGCLATSNTVSSQMRALLEKGFVERIQQGRESYYEIAETLFRICYEADLDHQGAPIRLFIDFLGNFYTAQELESRARGFHLLAQTVNGDAPAHETEAAFYRTALLRYHQRQFDDVPLTANPSESWQQFFRELSDHKAYSEIISFSRRLGETKDAAITLAEADAHVQRGNIEEACEILAKEIRRKPEEANLHAKLGSLLFNREDLPGAEACCHHALELDPENEFARRTLVSTLYKAGRYAEALSEFQFVMNASSEMSAVGLIMLASIHEAVGQTIEAERAWRNAVAADPADTTARFGLARNLGSRGDFEDALAQFEALLALDPTNIEALVLKGAILGELGRLSEAETSLQSALAKDPTSPVALISMGILFNRTDRPREALSNLNRLKQVFSSKLSFWLEMGTAHQALGQWQAAEASLRKALELDPTEEATSRLGHVLRKQKRFAEATALLREAIERWPRSAQLRQDLAKILFIADHPEESLEQIRVAQQLEPERAEYFVLSGFAAWRFGDMIEAEKDLRKAIGLNGDLAPAWRGLSIVMMQTDRPAEAVEALQKATSLAPDDADAWVDLGEAQESAGDLTQAEVAFRRAVELNEERGGPLLANLLSQTGRAPEAETILRELLLRQPTDTNARKTLVDILIRAGQTSQLEHDQQNAEQNLREAITLDPARTKGWILLSQTLSQSGRFAEAIDLLNKTPEEVDKKTILAARGDLYIRASDPSAARADYEAALQLDPNNAPNLLRFATIQLVQGQVTEATANAVKAIELSATQGDIVNGLAWGLAALFTTCTQSQMPTYLTPLLEALNRQGHLVALEQALSLTVFALLKQSDTISEERFTGAIWALENLVADHINVSLPVLFLRVGVDYFKHNDRKALMKLSREERALFTKQLAIDPDTANP